MLIIVPDEGTFEAFEESFDAEVLGTVLEDLEHTNVMLSLPKWGFEAEYGLSETLIDIGMVDAFSCDGKAEFSGMDGTYRLCIMDVFHKAFVAVDEVGTEAAAATAVVVGETGLPPDPVTLQINRPFILLIMDYGTETILFAGRVTNPEEG